MTADVATVRLSTLRLLVRDGAPIVLADVSNTLADLAAEIEHDPSWVVIVDQALSVCGVTSRAALVDALRDHPDGPVTDHMSRAWIALEPEDDVTAARKALDDASAEVVLVITSRGRLLGVATAASIALACTALAA